MKKILLLLTLLIAFGVPASFADSDANGRGGYEPFLFINYNYYEFQEGDILYDYDGIYFAPALYKRAFNLDITRSGDDWVITKDNKEFGRFKHTDMLKMDEETEIERAWTSEEKKDFLLLEGVLDILGDDFGYQWELINDPKTDTREVKLINTFVPKEFCNMDNLSSFSFELNVASVDKLKSLNNYVKKMSKNAPKINKTNNTVTYTDTSCTVIISLNNGDDITVSHTGKLTQTAYDLIGLAYNDVLDKPASKLAVAELKRLNGIMTTKSKASALKKLETRDSISWYYFGDDGFYKWSYDFSTVQGKKYLDFCITEFFFDTIEYYN